MLCSTRWIRRASRGFGGDDGFCFDASAGAAAAATVGSAGAGTGTAGGAGASGVPFPLVMAGEVGGRPIR